jgi:type I restriction enzyme M protein
MAKTRKREPKVERSNGATLGFEQKLWAAADKLRGHMDAAEYKHVVLGLIFLKYIRDAFEERRSWLRRETADPKSEYYLAKEQARDQVLEDRDEYTAENVFWVPKEARCFCSLSIFCRVPASSRPNDPARGTRRREPLGGA